MHLTSRALGLDDFDAFFHNCFYRVRHHQELRGVIAQEWRVLLGEAATLSRAIEDEERKPGERLVGCAQVAFVTERFVRYVRSEAAPWVNRAVVQPLPDGTGPLLDRQQLRQAHAAGEELSVLITRWNWANALLGQEDQMRILDYMTRTFVSLARGYRYREILMPATGQKALERSLSAGFRVRRDYADFYRLNPPAPQDHPYLMGVTHEEAFSDEGSLISHFFVYTPPRFGLTPDEQTLVYLAMAGETDDVIAAALGLPLSTVKNRWRAVYGKVEERHPRLWASLEAEGGPGEQRGKEKRRLLLIYLRDHPEELRPTVF